MRASLLGLFVGILLTAVGGFGTALHVCAAMGGPSVGDCDCERPEEVEVEAPGHEHLEAHHEGHAPHAYRSEPAKRQGLSAAPCCSVEWSPGATVRAVHEGSGHEVQTAQLVAWAQPGVDTLQSRAHCGPSRQRERAPPSSADPPLFVQHCSFLN